MALVTFTYLAKKNSIGKNEKVNRFIFSQNLNLLCFCNCQRTAVVTAEAAKSITGADSPLYHRGQRHCGSVHPYSQSNMLLNEDESWKLVSSSFLFKDDARDEQKLYFYTILWNGTYYISFKSDSSLICHV